MSLELGRPEDEGWQRIRQLILEMGQVRLAGDARIASPQYQRMKQQYRERDDFRPA